MNGTQPPASLSTHCRVTAEQFLRLLAPDTDVFCIRRIPEAKHAVGPARNYTGTLRDKWDQLVRDSKNGHGVFVVINEGGHTKPEIVRIRALFADLDGAPLQPLLEFKLEPHIVVESSAGRWHVYWLVEGIDLNEFTPLQKAIAARFNGDPAVSDLSRVMRLPGFPHQKEPK